VNDENVEGTIQNDENVNACVVSDVETFIVDVFIVNVFIDVFAINVLVVIESPNSVVKFICDADTFEVDIFAVDILEVDNDNTVNVDCNIIVLAVMVLPNIVIKLIGPVAFIVETVRVELTVS
jgi:hypothetical protein